MEEENDVVEDILNTSEESDLNSDDVDDSYESDTDEEIDYKAKFEAAEEARLKAEEVAKNQKIRAEKAEKKPKPEAQSDNLNTSDLYALMEAKVSSEDISEVTDYAKLKGIPVAEALKTSFVKAILNEKQEMRTTASATNTQTSRRSNKSSDDTLLANAAKGVLPESDEDIKRLIALKSK